MEVKTVIAIVLVMFIVGGAVWLFGKWDYTEIFPLFGWCELVSEQWTMARSGL